VNEYAIVIFYSSEDRGWIADVPDLKFCSAFGDTPSEALAEVQLAREAWLEAARESGREIPKPTFKPPTHVAG
jgi:predicted RNase H-like HicB family nuclease